LYIFLRKELGYIENEYAFHWVLKSDVDENHECQQVNQMLTSVMVQYP